MKNTIKLIGNLNRDRRSKVPLLIIALVVIIGFSFVACDDGNDNEQPADTLILVHYMPWYKGPSNKTEEIDISKYGNHWTDEGRFTPTQSTGGKAKIFAKQYPLTGPYHSGNTALLEYQASLMKIAGIDGVIFDWYGSYSYYDFGEVHEYTKAMVAVLKRAGLKFLICYEDNTINMMKKSGDEAINIGKTSFDWAQANWFKDSAYVCYDGKPVVLCFGPQYFNTKVQWDTVFSGVTPKPYFVDKDNIYSWADASYNWPPMWASTGGVLSQARLAQYLDQFYSGEQKNKPYRIASVFSAFDDAYKESLGYLEYADGAVFDLTWKKAVNFRPSIIQIVTWNDYGEGTIIEPTIDRGYKELEYVLEKAKEKNSSFPFNKEDLRWPLEFYKMRYNQTADNSAETAITAATNAVFAGNAQAFRTEAAKTGAVVNVNELKPLLR